LSDWLSNSAEAELVQALRDGDPRASYTLVELLLPQLTRFAQAFGLQEADAYSVALVTLEKAGRRIDSYQPRPGATFKSWIVRILFNSAKDVVRVQNRQRAREMSLEEWSSSEYDDTNSPETVVGSVEPATTVPIDHDEPVASPMAVITTTLLKRMTPRERDVMTRTADGMTDDAIADDLEMQVGAVRVARSRARASAKRTLQGLAPDLDVAIRLKLRKLFS
jgi:RNA polymerase sigma factor (sigma-70 family)